jgi:xanthine dehydrogenase accessory factor
VIQGMPDDVLAMNPPDLRTAVVALSHDPKIDDLALINALRSQAFYVGAMGSVRTTDARRHRLQMLDLTDQEVRRLRGPVGLDSGAKHHPRFPYL